MIRFAIGVALVAVAVTPTVVRGQAPWRQVYKDSDVTVIFDTASVTQQSPGTWTTVTSWDYSRPRLTEQKRQYNRLVERAYVRCSPVRVKRVRSTVYGSNNVLVRDEGEVDPRDQVHMVWDRPKAGTAARSASESVCGIIARKGGTRAAAAPAAATKSTPKKASPKR